jgi:hypothetical protein
VVFPNTILAKPKASYANYPKATCLISPLTGLEDDEKADQYIWLDKTPSETVFTYFQFYSYKVSIL